MKKIIILLAGIVMTVTLSPVAHAQTVPVKLEREMLMKTLRLLEEYEFNATMRNNEAASTFTNLFKNREEKIYNDLLGISEAEQLALPEYVKLMRANAVSPQVKLKNVRRGDVRDRGDHLEVVLTFDKEMRYNNRCGAILSSKSYFNDKDYAMEMVVSYDKSTGECSILSLKGNIDSNAPRLGQNFAIVEYSDPRDRDVTNNGKKLNFNVFDQAFVPLPYNFEYADDDENMKVNLADADCNKVMFSYHPRRIIVKPRISLGLGKGYSIDDSSPLLSTNSSVMEFGVDVGYVIPMKGKFKINVFAGLGFSTGKIDLKSNSFSYSYTAGANADMDGESYTRYYELSDLSQDIKLNHLVVPIYADFEYKFTKKVSAFAQLGFKGYFNMGSKVESFTGSMFAYGVYPQYNNLMIDASYMNDFGRSTFDVNSVSDLEFKGMVFDILAGIGVRAHIYGPVSIEAGVGYQVGMMPVIGTKGDPGTLRQGSITESQALVTYTVAGGTDIHSLTDYIGSIKHNSLRLNVGVIFKF